MCLRQSAGLLTGRLHASGAVQSLTLLPFQTQPTVLFTITCPPSLTPPAPLLYQPKPGLTVGSPFRVPRVQHGKISRHVLPCAPQEVLDVNHASPPCVFSAELRHLAFHAVPRLLARADDTTSNMPSLLCSAPNSAVLLLLPLCRLQQCPTCPHSLARSITPLPYRHLRRTMDAC